MHLVFEVCDVGGTEAVPLARKTFRGTGGVIGRGAGCDWVIPDPSRLLSSHHGLVSYREGRYFLTDISSNGICAAGGEERLLKGQLRLIEDADEFQLGALVIRARLVEPVVQDHAHRISMTGPIPDDAFLALDPLHALDRPPLPPAPLDELAGVSAVGDEAGKSLYHSAADTDYLPWPRQAVPDPPEPLPLSQPAPTVPTGSDCFWAKFATSLGIPMDALDEAGREALAIKVARMFRLGVEGLQQSLRACDELKSESNLGPVETSLNSPNPLRHCADADAALTALLGISEWGQLPAESAITQAHRDMQAHQVALLAACRSAVRHARSAFAPGHLLLCFDREGKPPRFNTDGAYWRAYQRHYQRVIEDDSLHERLPGSEFAKAYEEQVRLISTLHAVYPG